MVRRLGIVILGLVLPTLAGSASAAPKTGLVTGTWDLAIEFTDPQRLTVPMAGGRSETYWYVVYRVVNRTGQDVQFFPSFRLVTNTLDVVDAGDGVHPSAYDRIAALNNREFPFFAPPAKVSGLLLQGEENSRSSAAVFKAFNPEASSFTVFMSGMSGQVERVNNPAFNPKSPEGEANPRSFLFRRTLAVQYDLPGDAQTRAYATPIRRNREWVMR